MSTRWIIPVTVTVFAVLFAAIWFYLDQTHFSRERELLLADLAAVRSPPPAAVAAQSPPVVEPPAQPQFQSPPPPTIAQPTGGRKKTPMSLQPSLRERLPIIAARLDADMLKVRGDLLAATPIRLISATADLLNDQHAAALRQFDALLSRSPANVAAIEGRARALLALREYGQARGAYRQILRISPDDVQARYNYAVLLCRTLRFSEAVEQFYDVVERRPDHARAWFNLASLAQRDGKLIESRRAWRRFTDLQPHDSSGWFQLGATEMDLDNFDNAIFCFTYAVALAPDDLAAHLNLALAFAGAGDPHAALAATARARQHFPCSADIPLMLAELAEVFPHAMASSALPDPPP